MNRGVDAAPGEAAAAGDSMLQALPCGCGAAQLDGTLIWGNAKLATMLGVKGAAALCGQRLQSFLTVASRILFETHARPTLHIDGAVSEVFLEIKGPDKQRLPVLFSAQGDAQGTLYVVLYGIAGRSNLEVQLLQARQHAESLNDELLEERRMRECFVATLSHDLLSPISAGRLTAQSMLRAAKTERMQRGASRVLKTLDRAAAMIGDLLTANRLRAGEPLNLTRSRCDLAEVVRSLVADLADLHPQRVLYRGPEHLLGHFHADSLLRVVDNLITNGLKYGAADRAVTVSLQAHPEHVELAVHNWGAPIAAADQATIFQPYQRTASAQASNKKGWGLGLALVQGVAEAHQGSAHVRSSAADGTTFWLQLPAGALSTGGE